MIRLITISLYPIGYNCQYQIQKPSQNGKALVNTGSYKFINTLYGAGNGNRKDRNYFYNLLNSR